ncbi:Thiopurine S-methyltransferase [Lysobacter dokdonensis DS-58]|uniref:Thiopurine S-methyltransferase n=1 Tax=Lysobacter dokdonensis DS-58 TaxID=1300345 RepID=A0A0A2WLM2_9GAMM|nr:thiopurine S-methyltransferase [Lysobacter dokdonensis]KGQ20668.1 Thiopurine S-methyltransferase [Lysobacter dokdonensis DS-58]
MTTELEHDRENWLSRWREGRTGFHQDTPSPLLVECWERIGAPEGATVFVPLAGKTVDMPWLAEHGHRVFGVELAELAVEQFFAEQRLMAQVQQTPDGALWISGPIEVLCGDVFKLDAQDLADCEAFFDRAAIIALPPGLRRRYAREVYAQLPQGCVGLMITLEFPEHEKAGPPFSVREAEVRELFGPEWDVDVLVRRDILADQASFRNEGVTSLHAVAYRMQRR